MSGDIISGDILSVDILSAHRKILPMGGHHSNSTKQYFFRTYGLGIKRESHMKNYRQLLKLKIWPKKPIKRSRTNQNKKRNRIDLANKLHKQNKKIHRARKSNRHNSWPDWEYVDWNKLNPAGNMKESCDTNTTGRPIFRQIHFGPNLFSS